MLEIILRRNLNWAKKLLYEHSIRKKFQSVKISDGVKIGNIDRVEIGPGSVIHENVIICTAWLADSPPCDWNADGEIALGSNCRIRTGSILSCSGGGFIKLEENVQINPYCVIYGYGGLTIGSNTQIAAHTVIIPAEHEYSDPNVLIKNQPIKGRGIEIGEDVWVGANVTILDGVTIGNGCVIGAGSVVTKSIPPFSVAVGIPARVIHKRGRRLM